MINAPDKIIVHHDGVQRAGPSFDIINSFHQSREFPVSKSGLYVGYHYFIEYDGTVKQAREEDEEGAHTVGQNFSSIGIGLAGNFDVEWPTLQQIDALRALMVQICMRHNILPHNVFPHRHYAQKSCYGSRLDFDWARKLCVDGFDRMVSQSKLNIENGIQ